MRHFFVGPSPAAAPATTIVAARVVDLNAQTELRVAAEQDRMGHVFAILEFRPPGVPAIVGRTLEPRWPAAPLRLVVPLHRLCEVGRAIDKVAHAAGCR